MKQILVHHVNDYDLSRLLRLFPREDWVVALLRAAGWEQAEDLRVSQEQATEAFWQSAPK